MAPDFLQNLLQKIGAFYDRHTGLVLHVLVPSIITLFCMGLYFSGKTSLQQIILPPIPWLPEASWRELGLLEGLQDLSLLLILLLSLAVLRLGENWIERVLIVGLTCVSLFVFLEEADYGLKYYELVSRSEVHIEQRNWHNEMDGDEERVKLFKQISDTGLAVCFLILPLLFCRRRNNGPLSLLPSAWFAVSAGLAIGLSRLAHWFHDLGFDQIGGAEGGLTGNISEFREWFVYYLVLLYLLQLLAQRTAVPGQKDSLRA